MYAYTLLFSTSETLPELLVCDLVPREEGESCAKYVSVCHYNSDPRQIHLQQYTAATNLCFIQVRSGVIYCPFSTDGS